MKFHFSIGIEASSEQQAAEKLKALLDIKQVLTDKDLIDLARILKENPAIVKQAKQFLRP